MHCSGFIMADCLQHIPLDEGCEAEMHCGVKTQYCSKHVHAYLAVLLVCPRVACAHQGRGRARVRRFEHFGDLRPGCPPACSSTSCRPIRPPTRTLAHDHEPPVLTDCLAARFSRCIGKARTVTRLARGTSMVSLVTLATHTISALHAPD